MSISFRRILHDKQTTSAYVFTYTRNLIMEGRKADVMKKKKKRND